MCSFVLCICYKAAARSRDLICLQIDPFEETLGGGVFVYQEAHHVWCSLFFNVSNYHPVSHSLVGGGLQHRDVLIYHFVSFIRWNNFMRCFPSCI